MGKHLNDNNKKKAEKIKKKEKNDSKKLSTKSKHEAEPSPLKSSLSRESKKDTFGNEKPQELSSFQNESKRTSEIKVNNAARPSMETDVKNGTNEHTDTLNGDKNCEKNEISASSKKKHKKDKKKKKKHKQNENDDYSDNVKERKKKKKSKKRRRDSHGESVENTTLDKNHVCLSTRQPFDAKYHCKYVLAPMVGASELPFRYLCRHYGARLAYTPMISSTRFVSDLTYREEQLPTLKTLSSTEVARDRPLVAHFSANDPQTLAQCAKLLSAMGDRVDAIDLNLGCPQRTAYVGHFGSYLLDPPDRQLICNIVKSASRASSIPICVKIRLLKTIDLTVELCRQLHEAGAKWIAIHARHRASFERTGPGARDGPALLENVKAIKEALPNVVVIANGNVITFEDVEKNLVSTGAEGIMSAEGILNDPALFLPSLWKERQNHVQQAVQEDHRETRQPELSLPTDQQKQHGETLNDTDERIRKKKRKIMKKLSEIEHLEKSIERSSENNKNGTPSIKSNLDEDQQRKLLSKPVLVKKLEALEATTNSKVHGGETSTTHDARRTAPTKTRCTTSHDLIHNTSTVQSPPSKLTLAQQYLTLAETYPTTLRTMVFHTRRMCREYLEKYQLLESCLTSPSLSHLRSIVDKMQHYQNHPDSFVHDAAKARQEREALERKKRQEGKRKAYEARMVRKAKREGKTGSELYCYVNQGTVTPTVETVELVRSLNSREERLKIWKEREHAQHCLAFHLRERDGDGCGRGERLCAFLHVEAVGQMVFDEKEEVAG